MNLEELKKVVEKATPGPWIQSDHVIGPDQRRIASYFQLSRDDEVNEANGLHIATFNPSLVSKLLKAAEALQYASSVMKAVGMTDGNDPIIDAALRDLEQS